MTRMVAEKYLSPLVEEGIDVIILGCTHYPLLHQTIQEVVGEEIALVSSASETAKAVAVELSHAGLLSQEKGGISVMCASDDIEGFKRHFRAIVGDMEAQFHLLPDFERPPAGLVPDHG